MEEVIAKTPSKARARLLMLIPNLGFGGAQRVFHDHSRLLAERFDVTDVAFNLDHGHAFPSGNAVASLDVPGGGGIVAKLRHFGQRVRRLSALKRRIAPALTISHLEGADYINILAQGPGRRLLVIHGSKLHDANIAGPVGWLRRRGMIPALYNRADLIVTVAEEIAVELEAIGVRPELLRTIPNFFDPDAIRARARAPLTPAEQALFEGPPVLVTSGRLARQKNHAGLLAAFALLVARRPARLLLIGDGELRGNLIAQARALGLDVAEGADGAADVHFLGFQDNPFRLQRHADLFVLPSGWEGFPMVLGEAMACGLPIVSADCPTGPREFLAPGTIRKAPRPLRRVEAAAHGLLMPIPLAGDPASLDPWVETLDHLLGDAAERKRLAARSLARADDFSIQRIGPQWLALVEELVGPSATSA